MEERILVPLDGSKEGESALAYIEELVSKLAAEVEVEVCLLHVLPPIVRSYPGEEGGPYVTYAHDEVKRLTSMSLEYLKETGEPLRQKGVTVVTKVEVNSDACDEIVRTAEEMRASLIAMSTHGGSGLSRWAFGGVTDKVLRREEDIPTIVVRAKKYARY